MNGCTHDRTEPPAITSSGVLWENIDIAFEREGGDRVWIGTVFALTPSGKYYTAWACGNVSPSEVRQDEQWFACLAREAEAHGYWIERGEDPCDIFVCRDVLRH